MSLAFPDLKLAALAHARYPDVDPVLSISFLESDRRAAGMGALKPRSRRGGSVRNTKEVDLLSRRIIYTRSIDARDEFPPLDLGSIASMAQAATATITRVPPRCKAVQVAERDLYENRPLVARYLRELRRATRRAP